MDIYARLQDRRHEGASRNNLADTLTKLQRYDEARRELHRAIDCNQPFGHAAEPWKAWNNLHDLEQVSGNSEAEEAAHEQAIANYLAHRRAGGESQSNAAELFDIIFQAIQQGSTTNEAEEILDELSRGDIPGWDQTLVAGLRAILRGARDPSLAADPNLYYRDAVELQLLLEALGE